MLKKKIWVNFQRIIELFAQKIVTKLSKVWVWDPGSEIRKKPIPDPGVKKAPDPGVKKAPDPGSGSATLPKTLVFKTGSINSGRVVADSNHFEKELILDPH